MARQFERTKKTKGMTSKQLADATKIPESTIKRIFAGDTEDPYVSTIHRIVIALGGSLDYVLADTNVVLSPESLVEVKENADVVEAERNLVLAENEMKASAEMENQLQRTQGRAPRSNYYIKSRQNKAKRGQRHNSTVLIIYKAYTNVALSSAFCLCTS